MKILITFIFSVSFVNLFAQVNYDTIRIVNYPKQLGTILTGSFYERELYPERFKNKKAKEKGKFYSNATFYQLDGKTVSQEEYEMFMHKNDYLNSCKPCYVYYYDEKNKLLFEGLKYSDCPIGAHIDYYPNGKPKLIANYKTPPYDIKKEGLHQGDCAIKHGKFIYYNVNGGIDSTATYIDNVKQE
jgi:antitoxin component YwqK of YwqJK toxin-antitoxin module